MKYKAWTTNIFIVIWCRIYLEVGPNLKSYNGGLSLRHQLKKCVQWDLSFSPRFKLYIALLDAFSISFEVSFIFSVYFIVMLSFQWYCTTLPGFFYLFQCLGVIHASSVQIHLASSIFQIILSKRKYMNCLRRTTNRYKNSEKGFKEHFGLPGNKSSFRNNTS